MRINWKKVFNIFGSAALCTTLVVSTTGCTDEEVQVGVGAAAIGAGAYLIGDALSDRDRGGYYSCRGGYRNACDSYRDYWGNWRRSCRSVYDSCASRVWRHRYNTFASNNKLAHLPTDVSSVGWANKFQMSHNSAVTLISAFKASRNGDGSRLQQLGLNKKDLRRLAKFDMPSDRSVDSIARSLNQNPQATRLMLSQLVRTAESFKD